MKIDILGTYELKNKVTFQPRGKCCDCPFLDEGAPPWCNYLKKRIDNGRNDDCPVTEITVEEK